MRRSRLFFTTSMGSKCNDDPNMPQVGMIVTHKVGRWKVLRNIATGPFSDVFIIADVENSKRKFAMKCEKQEGNTRPVLKLDVLVLMSVKGAVGFPLFIAAGRTSTYRYCVMQLVGPDLGKLRRSLIDKRFSVPTALRVLQQTLRRLEVLHDAGWLCRDVKAPNFAIGIGSESGVIYMLDFGFARKYKEANGEIIPPRSAAALLGTFQYTPLASHDHKDQAPKDDLESWFYMAAELLKGPLPWCKIDGHKEHQTIAAQKKLIRRERRAEFMEGMPSEFDRILTMIDNMGFYDRPPYTLFQSLIEQAAKKLRITLHEPFDWQVNARVLKKAEWSWVQRCDKGRSAPKRICYRSGPLPWLSRFLCVQLHRSSKR
ncbi:hypothetical protein Y032_0089g2236 [Ancylostoma ceylanicum]|uniref:Protein kinase domain-containing protein n=2 Tax=Ancylostoma ceylanicum TaxID=53326 RepID=A0A016TN16_9BILA|nr:hypothetical protein Y032_0089g2236 [Ancylostoma ceylanicum]